MLIGVPATFCVVVIVLLYFGLAYGVDPLEAPIKSNGVSALTGSQGMGADTVWFEVSE